MLIVFFVFVLFCSVILLFLYTFFPYIELSVNQYIPKLSSILYSCFEDVTIDLHGGGGGGGGGGEGEGTRKMKMMTKKTWKADTFDVDAFRYGDELYIIMNAL